LPAIWPVSKKCSRSRPDGLARLANIDCRQDGTALDPAMGRASYIFNPTIEGIEDADAILIIGSNPRHEAPILNARIRKRWRG
jgi:NADH-quinone oxidoreductase subunit G